MSNASSASRTAAAARNFQRFIAGQGWNAQLALSHGQEWEAFWHSWNKSCKIQRHTKFWYPPHGKSTWTAEDTRSPRGRVHSCNSNKPIQSRERWIKALVCFSLMLNNLSLQPGCVPMSLISVQWVLNHHQTSAINTATGTIQSTPASAWFADRLLFLAKLLVSKSFLEVFSKQVLFKPARCSWTSDELAYVIGSWSSSEVGEVFTRQGPFKANT